MEFAPPAALVITALGAHVLSYGIAEGNRTTVHVGGFDAYDTSIELR